MENKKVLNRQSNIELIRVVAIILIVLSHYSQHGLAHNFDNRTDFYILVAMFLRTLGQIGVTLFVLITGYFMIDGKFSIKKIFKIAFDTLFYSWSILLIMLIFFKKYIAFNFYPDIIYKSVLPISTNQYWFVTTYLILYLCFPLLNIIFNNTEKKKLKKYGIIFGILWFIIPPFMYKIHFAESPLLCFFYIYFIGAYIKRYGIEELTRIKSFILIIISELIIISWLFICTLLHIYDSSWYGHLSSLNSIFILLTSTSLFVIFLKWKIKYNHIINYIAGSSFAVYLITENICMRKLLWLKIFKCNYSTNALYILLNSFFAIVISYLLCIVINQLKKIYIDKIIFK